MSPSRPVTKRDRALAIKRELLNTTSPIRITAGMRRAMRGRKFARGGGQGLPSSRRPWHRWLNPFVRFIGRGDQ